MKRHVSVTFSIILFCGLLALQTVVVSGYQEGYETTNYLATDPPVIDGAWTDGDWTYDPGEWGDSAVPPNLPDTFLWREKWTWDGPILERFLIEALTDNTTDSGDYFELCVDQDADGGSAPQANDFRVYYTGDGTLTIYEGDGSEWVEFTEYTMPDDIEIAASVSSSPSESNTHWIIEMTMNRDSGALFDVSTASYNPWIRLAVYDASNDAAGVQAWPLDSSPDVPDEWGIEYGTTENIPEALTVGVVILLSSVAVAVSFYFLRKRPQLKVIAKK